MFTVYHADRTVANEIRTHFRLKAKAIREQITKWKALDDGKSTDGPNNGGGLNMHSSSGRKLATALAVTKTDFETKADAVKKLLKDLESGKIGGA